MVEKDLIIGNWYYAYEDSRHIIKYLRRSGSASAYCSEHLYKNTEYKSHGGKCGLIVDLKPVKISEIAKYLPKNHLDLKQNILQSLEIW